MSGATISVPTVPETIHAVLAARIDRLPPEAKHLVQTAAVLGNSVPVPLLRVIAAMPEEVLQRNLAHLQAMEVLYETRVVPELTYTFKHALTHEVAYGSLLQERRRGLHARIVEEAPFVWVAHDVGPRAMSAKVKGVVQPKSWFIDLAPMSME